MVRLPAIAGDGERGVEQHAGAAREPHDPAPVDAVGQHAGGQQRRGQSEQVQRLAAAAASSEPVRCVGDQREDEHAHPAADLGDGLPDPEHGEVVVAGEGAVAGISATYIAQ